MMLIDFLNDVYVTKKINIRKSSADQLRFTINNYSRFLGHNAVVPDLTEIKILRFLSYRLQEGLARKTVSQNRGNLLVLWRAAHRWKYHPEPVADIDCIRVPKKQPRAFTVEESSKILNEMRSLQGTMRETGVLKSDWWMSLFLFIYDTGSRVGATLSVTPSHVNFGDNSCVMTAESDKTWSEHTVRFSDQTADVMKMIYDPNREFVWDYPWNRRQLWIDFNEILKSAGIPPQRYVGFHKIRRTHATQMVINSGWDAARESLGHSSLTMTKKYVDPTQAIRGRVDLPRP